MTELVAVLPKEAPVYLASKWIHLDLLVDKESFEGLLDSFGVPLYLFSTLGVGKKGSHEVSKEAFLDAWQRYIACIQEGRLPQEADFRFLFTLALTCDLGALRSVVIDAAREVIIPYLPLMQMQIHRFSFSKLDKKFHSMAFGEKSIFWGVRLSYPQLFQHPDTRQVEDALDETKFPNAALFSRLKSWMRQNSQPTPFVVDGKRENVPMRIGKSCFSWINRHPGLLDAGLSVG